jgi:uridine phosphorylase
MTRSAPILDYDEDRTSILMPNPYAIGVGVPIPNRAVLCFFQDVITAMVEKGELTLIGNLHSEMGKHPVYSYLVEGTKIAVFQPGVGAPLAAAFMEELIACGVTKYMVCGGCGVLNREIEPGHPMIIKAAVRDEGTSYHYLAPAHQVKASASAVNALEVTLEKSGIEYRLVKSWTTDAIYRETPGRRKIRVAEGCDIVEMEAAAFFAVAQFREVELGQLVYAGDLVVPDGWDGREWHKRLDDRRLVFDLAVKSVLKL